MVSFGRDVTRDAVDQPGMLEDMDRRKQAEEAVGAEWAEWYFLTPEERWREQDKMWEIYLAHGGSPDPEPDSQSPFFDEEERRTLFGHGRPGVRVVRRGGV